MWRDRFSRGLLKMGKRDLRVATQILIGHAELNYHLRKLNRDIAPTCSLCQEENETVEHVLTRCPLLWELRVELFNSHVTTIAAIRERFDITRLVKSEKRERGRSTPLGCEQELRSHPLGLGPTPLEKKKKMVVNEIKETLVSHNELPRNN
ncbi:hypothetical protein ACHWQZ_G007588 [Mnemiopsis leidyi]